MSAKDFLISIFILALIFIALLFGINSDAAEPKKSVRSFGMTQEESDQCKAGGGCILITKDESEKIIELMESLEKEARKDKCKFKTI